MRAALRETLFDVRGSHRQRTRLSTDAPISMLALQSTEARVTDPRKLALWTGSLAFVVLFGGALAWTVSRWHARPPAPAAAAPLAPPVTPPRASGAPEIARALALALPAENSPPGSSGPNRAPAPPVPLAPHAAARREGPTPQPLEPLPIPILPPKALEPAAPTPAPPDPKTAHVEMGPAVNVAGDTSSARVATAVRHIHGQLTACYRAVLPSLRAPVDTAGVLHLETDETGLVTNASLTGPDFAARMASCAVAAAKTCTIEGVNTESASADIPLLFKTR
jgi:hypothetical protein